MKSKTLLSLVVLTLCTSLIPAMHAQTFSVIHTFTTGSPVAGVTIRGNTLYGAASSNQACTVYQLTNTGSNWLFSTIADSSNCDPRARVVFGPDSHLYGTSSDGGAFGGGDVFKLTPQVGPCKDAACYWAVSDLHDFLLDSKTDGDHPGAGDLIWDQQGNIYGTTQQGGSGSFNCQNLGCGTVYELTPSGNGYTENVIYRFSGPDGAYPNGLVFDNNGNLFGTAGGGGANDDGAIFELTYVVGVGWTEHVLYSFQNATDGIYGPIFDSAGNLYGTTTGTCCTSSGTVFELSPSGDSWVFTTLYAFPAGDYTYGGVALGPDGALYGTFNNDSTQGGSVFKLTKTQNGWQYTSLHDFGVEEYPECTVRFDTQGNLYGTIIGEGAVWMIKP